jgi:hypothetical protein
VTAGRDWGGTAHPSWEQLLTGGHHSVPAPGRVGRAVAPRHGRDGWGDDWGADGERFESLDLGPLPDDDAMGWVDAAAWTIVGAGVGVLLVTRLGELVR